MIVPLIGARTLVSSSWICALSTATWARTTAALALAKSSSACSCSCSVIDWDLNSSSARRFCCVGVGQPRLGHVQVGLGLSHRCGGSGDRPGPAGRPA